MQKTSYQGQALKNQTGMINQVKMVIDDEPLGIDNICTANVASGLGSTNHSGGEAVGGSNFDSLLRTLR